MVLEAKQRRYYCISFHGNVVCIECKWSRKAEQNPDVMLVCKAVLKKKRKKEKKKEEGKEGENKEAKQRT